MSIFPATVCLQMNFTRNRALANGISLLGFSTGGILGPNLVELLIQTYGWRGTLLILGGLMLHRVPIAMTFRPPKSPKTTQTADETPTHPCSKIVSQFLECSVLRHKSFVLFLMSELMNKFYVTALVTHLASYAVHKGYTTAQAAALLTFLQVFNLAFRVLTSLLSNLKSVNLMVMYSCGALFGMVSIVVMLTWREYAGLILASILAGSYTGQLIIP